MGQVFTVQSKAKPTKSRSIEQFSIRCQSVAVVLLYFALGLIYKTRATFNQSDAKRKPITHLVTRVFPRFRQVDCLNFKLSLALNGIFHFSDWPLWLLWFSFYDH